MSVASSLRSMTGFAREAGETGRSRWAWEIKTVNGRGLEVRVRTPPGHDAVGEVARKLFAGALTRGQCHLTLAVSREAGPSRTRVNGALLAELVAAVAALERPAGIGSATLDGLLAVRGVVEVEDGPDDALDEALDADLAAAAGRLVERLQRARAEEGAALARVLAVQLDRVEALVADAEASPGRRPEAVRARLGAQVAELLGTGLRLDPERLHAEAALLATRADVREEIDRLGAHLAAARALLAEGGAVGRRLDFLAQEFGREANTLGAKAGDIALSRVALDLKAVVEQFREQVQNVE